MSINRTKRRNAFCIFRVKALNHLKRKKKGWYLLQEPIMRYWLGGMIFLALYCPLNILDQYLILKDFVRLLSYIFPPINNYSENSNFPQVTALYLSVSWVTSPLHAYYLLVEYKTDSSDWVIYYKNPLYWTTKEIIKAFIFLICMIFVLYFMAFKAMGHDFNILPLNTSRFALGIGGWIIGGGTVALATFCYIQTRQLLSIIF